jgi:hypothetical protein
MKSEWLYAIGSLVLLVLTIIKILNHIKKDDIVLIIKQANYMSAISVILFIITLSTIAFDLLAAKQQFSQSFRDLLLAMLFAWLAVSFHNNYKITKTGLVLGNNPVKWDEIIEWQWLNNILVLKISDATMKKRGKIGVAKVTIKEDQREEVSKHLSNYILKKKVRR